MLDGLELCLLQIVAAYGDKTLEKLNLIKSHRVSASLAYFGGLT